MTRYWNHGVLGLAILALTSGSVFAQPGTSNPQMAKIMKEREGNLKPGDTAPNFRLKMQNGKGEVELAELLKNEKPVVLVFGSYSCGPFRNAFGGVNDEYQKHQDHAQFYMIYTKEAHPSDGTKHTATEGKPLPGNDRLGISIKQHSTEQERQAAAGTCSAKLDIAFPVLLDTLDDKYCLEYSGFPSRIYIIAPDGRIAYKSGPGPFGFKPNEISTELEKLLQVRDAHVSNPDSRR